MSNPAAVISRKLVLTRSSQVIAITSLIVKNWFRITDKEIVHKKIIVTHGTDVSTLIKDRYNQLKLCVYILVVIYTRVE